MDHANPGGKQISIAVSRIQHTAAKSLGPLLVNPGGPGAPGRGMAGSVAKNLRPEVAAQFDVIGFDPRGAGASEPHLDCIPGFNNPVRPDTVPNDFGDELANIKRVYDFAQACGTKYGDFLKYMNTPAQAADMDSIRAALGAKQLSYFGYSYGTYLGSVYAKLFPSRVKRLVLDSIVDPSKDSVWYGSQITQDVAFDNNMKAFFEWVAKYDANYHLGTDPAKVESAWYEMRGKLSRTPAEGVVGASELEDAFAQGGYNDSYWAELAEGFSGYVVNNVTKPLRTAYNDLAAASPENDNINSGYLATQCRDAAWPKDWWTWHKDAVQTAAKAPFLTWNNVWFNAACAFWPTSSLKPVNVANDRLPKTLLFQATNDAATPYEGGVTMHRLLRDSALVVEQGGRNHGISMSGSSCLDNYLNEYLATGKTPKGNGHGPADAVCQKQPDPVPNPAAAKSTADTGKVAKGAL
ncbi:alpha/beta hydrolase [Embleya sp. AB8]|uniref:alpha/beta hydrolase n=1 Tax=Embleya sp. AB8 TaxID=3156304 RepID=UPI003C720D04